MCMSFIFLAVYFFTILSCKLDMYYNDTELITPLIVCSIGIIFVIFCDDETCNCNSWNLIEYSLRESHSDS